MLILTHFNTTTEKKRIEKACEEKICSMFFFRLKFQIQDIISEKLFNDTENVYDFHKL